MVAKYDPAIIEPKWRRTWDEMQLYKTQVFSDRPKAYCLDMFPYPSGDGLSVGHLRNYVPTDVMARYKRMQGYSVLHPMGWDAFGLPAENEAIKKKIHPTLIVPKHTGTYKRQMNLVSISYDWEKEINTSNPKYYKWTQWFFLLLYRRGLAYRARNAQWWCPVCKTILANEQVENGACWRGHFPIERKQLEQWYFKITAYADALEEDLELVDWPEHIVTMQKNWIGRSEGVDVRFSIPGSGKYLDTFTTRPDTLFGVTFIVLAPEHPLLEEITVAEQRQTVREYLKQALVKSDIDRSLSKTGVFTGSYAIHPLTKEMIPIWVADYVVQAYGTGAVMGVPAHDKRDFAFATTYNIPIIQVIVPPGQRSNSLVDAYEEPGVMINSGRFNGFHSEDTKLAIAEELQKNAAGSPTVRYRMRDWLISRQRYWGAPIPIVYCDRCGIVPVSEDQLPVLLPYVEHYEPTGMPESPLAGIPEFVNSICPSCGGPAKRETDTLDGFACSSWYFLRFPDVEYQNGPFNPELINYWLPVDLYVGGAEHAVMHLLYARMWTKVMNDAGLVKFREPFSTLKSQGVVLGPDGTRMSKSKGNVITPDDVVKQYGADTLRLYELAVAPFENEVAWNEQGIVGMRRFLDRLWLLNMDSTETTTAPNDAADTDLKKQLHRTIKRVTNDIESFSFNTAVSAFIEFVNSATKYKELYGTTSVLRMTFPIFLRILAPIAPHITEEIWHECLEKPDSIHLQEWPRWDEDLLKEEFVEIPIQVNGKKRGVLNVPVNIPEQEIVSRAMKIDTVRKWISEPEKTEIFYVPNRILNIVTSGRQSQ